MLKCLTVVTVILKIPEQFIYQRVFFLSNSCSQTRSARLCESEQMLRQLPSPQRWVSSAPRGWEARPLGKRDRQVFPSCSRKWAKPCPEIMTPALCRVKEATPDSAGYRFPVVGQQFWLRRALSGRLNKTESRTSNSLTALYHDTERLKH